MRKIRYEYVEQINPEVTEYVLELTAYIAKQFDLYITCSDAYNLWRQISLEHYRIPWLEWTNLENYHSLIIYALKNYCSLDEGIQ